MTYDVFGYNYNCKLSVMINYMLYYVLFVYYTTTTAE